MKRHAALTRHRPADRLLFVSNIRHRRPELRSIKGYVHPKNQDHYLWVDLLPALESDHRKGTLAARILADFREALKIHGMVGRTIAGATDSLYTRGSEANHLVLTQLAGVLRKVGFAVTTKRRRETTLRVYPRRHREYPLLNPRFVATATWWDPALDIDSLVFTVFSRSKSSTLDTQLAQFPSTRDCQFVADSFQHVSGYRCHGYFILPVRFSGRGQTSHVDFTKLASSLGKIHAFLTS